MEKKLYISPKATVIQINAQPLCDNSIAVTSENVDDSRTAKGLDDFLDWD